MKIIKRFTSYLLIMCLIFTPVSFQAITAAAALQADDSVKAVTNTEEDNQPINSEAVEMANTSTAISISDSANMLLKNNNSGNTDINASKVDDLDNLELYGSDDISPLLSNAFINGNIISLSFNEALDDEKVPSLKDFKVKITYNGESAKVNTGLEDPVYTISTNPVYNSSTGTTVYPILAENTEINEISIFDNKVILTLANAVTSSSAVTLDYTTAGESDLLCDKAGNEVENFSEYGVSNITGEAVFLIL